MDEIPVDLGDPTRVGQFADSSSPGAPLLRRRDFVAEPKFVTIEELRLFRLGLRWWALEQTSHAARVLSFSVFFLFAVVVPLLGSLWVRLDPSAEDDAPLDGRLAQIPSSALAAVSFVSLAGPLRRHGLRRLLSLDRLSDDPLDLRWRYAAEIGRAARRAAWIAVPSMAAELAHEVLWFWRAEVRIPGVSRGMAATSVVFTAVAASWIYRTGVFMMACAVFRLTCELQILRLEGFRRAMEGCGSEAADAGDIFRWHVQIRRELHVTSHRFRGFIVASLVVISVSQLGALLVVLSTRWEKSFLNSGDLAVGSVVQLSGFLLCILGAARITHRAQAVASVASKWHAMLSCMSTTGPDSRAGKPETPADQADDFPPTNCESDSESSEVFALFPSEHASSFDARQALVTYLHYNSGGVTVYGFTLDRGLLHTVFAFQFSLVLWILSKVVVISSAAE
ncbi:uncharacterized protein LOC116248562 [Nymphaea colorata]|nr:uncharacterized protein LOC116248562 [Nymphaea colorata]